MQEIKPETISEILQTAGVAGAGGAGFPSYVKWETIKDVECLMINHQESEPNCYADKWLARHHAEAFGELLDSLLEIAVDTIVVGTKAKYRGKWMEPFETANDMTVYETHDLPIDVSSEQGIVLAYTPDVYTYSEEKVLLMVSAGEQIGDDLPTEHGWIVHNTETMFNIYQALSDGTPVTRKYVHVDGNTTCHRCLDVPIGTPASTLLEAAGVDGDAVGDDQILADGGPGWCYEIKQSPLEFGVRKRTNAVLVLDRTVALDHTEENGQIDVLAAYDWSDTDHETEPRVLEPESVRIPLITNTAYRGFVSPSEAIVEPGDRVLEGEVIAVPGKGVSNTQHASIEGKVVEVTETHIVIERS